MTWHKQLFFFFVHEVASAAYDLDHHQLSRSKKKKTFRGWGGKGTQNPWIEAILWSICFFFPLNPCTIDFSLIGQEVLINIQEQQLWPWFWLKIIPPDVLLLMHMIPSFGFISVWSALFSACIANCVPCVSFKVQCHLTTRTTMSPLQRSPYGDFLHFDSAPDTIAVNSSVQMSYTCSKACRVVLEIVLSTPKVVGLVTFRRSWTHVRQLKNSRTRTVQLTFPPAMVYKRDFFFRRTVEARDVILRAWLVYLDGAESNSSYVGVIRYEQSMVRTFKTLRMVPQSERPSKFPSRCVAWGAELMWNRTQDRTEKCSPESGEFLPTSTNQIQFLDIK